MILLGVFTLTLLQGFPQTDPAATAEWLTNLEEAQAVSEQSSRPILMVFSGSDWCKPCILLRRQVFNSPEFQTYAEKNLVLLELDFPAQKKNKLSKEQTTHNEALADKFNPKGAFPLAVVINHEEQVLGHFAYTPGKDPQSYIHYINSISGHANP